MRVRLFSLLAAAALFLVAALPANASALSDGHVYLALGDSVPFGFNPLVNANNADNFVGYPESLAAQLGIKDVNASCPGEATGGFLSLTGTDNVCRPYRASFPLHVEYHGSQMAFAMRYLTGHRNTRLITLMLGANDLFRFQKDCVLGPTVGTCPLGFDGMLAVMRANLSTILANIRATGYKGLIVGVTYYSLSYTDLTQLGGALALAGQMEAAAAANGALIADGVTAWEATAFARGGGDSCAAGLLIALPGGGCDVHPTPAGRDLLAGAVLDTIAASCPAHDAAACLSRAEG